MSSEKKIEQTTHMDWTAIGWGLLAMSSSMFVCWLMSLFV